MTAPVQVGPSPSGGGPVPSPDWDDVLADLGDRIRAERQARTWSQVDLARRCGLTKAQVQRLEFGFIGMRNFAIACWALDVPMAWLLSDEWRMPERIPSLTGRQVEVLSAVADGDSLWAAEAVLGLSQETVAGHLSEIYRRLGVTGLPRADRRAAAVRVAREHGLLHSQ